MKDQFEAEGNTPFHEVRATFKGHEIVATQDVIGCDWYIRVTAPSGSYTYDGWWRDSAGKTADQVQARYRELAAQHHPDRGGDVSKMAEINAARDEAMQELGG